MKDILYVNAAFREGSRTAELAEAYLEMQDDAEITRVDLGSGFPHYLDAGRLERYCLAVSGHQFDDPMFDAAKSFCDTDEIVIAAPFWNMSIPAVLHMYLEMVCTQGISFDLSKSGAYISGVRAEKLTLIMTAGGPIPEEDHAYAYLKQLNDVFWKIPVVQYIYADRLDMDGMNAEELLAHPVIRTSETVL